MELVYVLPVQQQRVLYIQRLWTSPREMHVGSQLAEYARLKCEFSREELSEKFLRSGDKQVLVKYWVNVKKLGSPPRKA